MARYHDVYADPQWEPARKECIRIDEGCCRRCRAKGIIKAGTQVHHIIWLTEQNKNDWNIAYCQDNLELTCDDCHQHEHGRSIGIQNFISPPVSDSHTKNREPIRGDS